MPNARAQPHATPAAPPAAAARESFPLEPYWLGYPQRRLLLRALLPIALAFLLFLAYGATDSGPTAPRPAAPGLPR
ncbi:MAG: hypothetical protein KF715_13910 [Candidatus Didemnitutus sp.]|nr:hypothetical protein [Candidatus Didemnitutus sp.]